VYFDSVAWAVRCDVNNGRADESMNELAVVHVGHTKSFFETGVDETNYIGRQLFEDDVVGHRVSEVTRIRGTNFPRNFRCLRV